MKLLVLSALAVTLCKGVKHMDDGTNQWELFKIEHEKEYNSVEEEELRKNIFIDNLNFVNEHNAKYEKGEESFTVEINKFADMTPKEFSQIMNGLRIPSGHRRSVATRAELNDDWDLPKTVDWRAKGAVTPVKYQGMCDSCWAFSTTGALEGQTFLKKKKLISLSEQNLLDCSKKQGNMGCSGGDIGWAFEYILANGGIDTETSYPYEAEDKKCRYKPKSKGAEITAYVNVTRGSESHLQKAVANVGPISVAIDAYHASFMLYKSGVYKEKHCSSKILDHAALAVGYGTAKKGGDYWLVKNSWGTHWGMKGYVMMARNNNNMCGIATHASYPIV